MRGRSRNLILIIFRITSFPFRAIKSPPRVPCFLSRRRAKLLRKPSSLGSDGHCSARRRFIRWPFLLLIFQTLFGLIPIQRHNIAYFPLHITYYYNIMYIGIHVVVYERHKQKKRDPDTDIKYRSLQPAVASQDSFQGEGANLYF